MAWHLPQNVLSKLRARYVTEPNQLTEQEQVIAGRIMLCHRCGHVWMRRLKAIPERCVRCHNYRYDTPTIDALVAMEAQTQKPGQPAIPYQTPAHKTQPATPTDPPQEAGK